MGYTLPAEWIRQLRAMARRLEALESLLGVDTSRHLQQSQCWMALAPAGGIAAKSGSTLGSATVTLRKIDDSGDEVNFTDENGDDVTVTAYNRAAQAVAADAPIIIERVNGCDLDEPAWVVVWEEC